MELCRVYTRGVSQTLYRDDDLLVINKPSGLSVHRGLSSEKDCVVDRLSLELRQKIYSVHRLDRGTSGALVVALNADTARSLSEQFSQGGVTKQYVVLVRGALTESVDVDYAIPVDEGGPRVDAQTRFDPLAVVDLSERSTLRETRYSLLMAQPKTGRFHQIRRHSKHLGHPVIGDANYGRSEHNRLLAALVDLRRLALHSWRLAFTHPSSGLVMSVCADVPCDLAQPLQKMGFDRACLRENLPKKTLISFM